MKSRIVASMIAVGVMLGSTFDAAGTCTSCTVRRPLALIKAVKNKRKAATKKIKAAQRKKSTRARAWIAKKIKHPHISRKIVVPQEKQPVAIENQVENSVELSESPVPVVVESAEPAAVAAVVEDNGHVVDAQKEAAPSWGLIAKGCLLVCKLKALDAWDKVRSIWS